MTPPSWASTRSKIRLVERHKERCETCRLALDSLVGKYPMCPEGDGLVWSVFRDVYERHMAAVRARKEHHRERPVPFI